MQVVENLNEYIDKGLYSIPEIAKLADADSQLVRRWLMGYSYGDKDEKRFKEGLFKSDFDKVDGHQVYSFHDLIEVLFVVNFKKEGVNFRIIREAFELARERFDSKHPFSKLQFKTDGKSIFEEVYEGKKSSMSNLNTGQLVFAKVIEQSLCKALEFVNDEASVWYPNYPSKRIVVDPKRAFGRPVLNYSGVPVEIISAAYEADESFKFVASDYEISVADVKAAIKFENSFG